jgi:hypothetical protein
MLVEHGFTRVTAGDGREWSFTPSLGRIAFLGDPYEVVHIFGALHGPKAEAEAAYVLACLCDQEDPTELVGWHDREGWHDGLMDSKERVIVAQHLMRHGVVGKASPEKGDGKFSERFDAAEHTAAAQALLGLSSVDAEALSMTELQAMLAVKYPEMFKKKRDVATREEYDRSVAAIAKLKERRRG